MKSHTEYLTFNLPERMAFVNIMARVEEALRKSGVQEGLCLVNTLSTAVGVLWAMHPSENGYSHQRQAAPRSLPKP